MVMLSSGGKNVLIDGSVWSWDSLMTNTINSYGSAPSVRMWARSTATGELSLDPMDIWITQRSVRTVVGFIARNTAQINNHVYANTSTGRQRIRTGPLADVIKTPKPGALPFQEEYNRVADQLLYGRHVRAFLRINGRWELHRLPPSKWKYVRDSTHEPEAIRLSDGRELPLLGNFLYYDGYPIPTDHGDAYSPLEHLRPQLLEDHESSKYRAKLWANGARIDGSIERGLDAPEWEPADAEYFMDSWRSSFTGTGAGVGGTALLEDGMRYRQHRVMTPADAQQIEVRQLTTKEVASAFFLPAMYVNAEEQASYKGVEGYREVLYEDTLGPAFEESDQVWNIRVAPYISTNSEEYVEAHVRGKLRMSLKDQISTLVTAAGRPLYALNEARAILNLPDQEGGDEVLLPSFIDPNYGDNNDSDSENENNDD